MDTYDKLKIVESIDEIPTFTAIGGQSVKASFTCGCSFVQHGYCGKPKQKPDTENYDRAQATRQFWVELCAIHKNISIKKLNAVEP